MSIQETDGSETAPDPDAGPRRRRRLARTPDGELDLARLPKRFTVNDLEGLKLADVLDLERVEQDLDEEQRKSFREAKAEWTRPIAEAMRRKYTLPGSFVKSFKLDPIGERVRDSVRRQSELLHRPIELPKGDNTLVDIATRQRKIEEGRWARQHQLIEAVADSTAALAERTEQQHQEANRQRLLTWLLAFAVIVAMVAPLVQAGWSDALLSLGIAAPVFLLAALWTYRHRLRGQTD